jgi:hypothetical protein
MQIGRQLDRTGGQTKMQISMHTFTHINMSILGQTKERHTGSKKHKTGVIEMQKIKIQKIKMQKTKTESKRCRRFSNNEKENHGGCEMNHCRM